MIKVNVQLGDKARDTVSGLDGEPRDRPMSITQRYAGMLRRHAAEWDKQSMPVQAECCRQAARHMETRELELKHALTVTGETLDKECDDSDELLRLLDLDPATYRTEGGRMNLLKIRAALAERKTPNVI